MSFQGRINTDNPAYSRQKFIKFNQIDEFNQLIDSHDLKGKLSSRERKRFIFLDNLIKKEVLLNLFLQYEDPYSARRDEIRSDLNKAEISFTGAMADLGYKTFSEMRDSILGEAGINRNSSQSNDFVNRDFFEKNPKIKDDSLLDYSRGYFVTAAVGQMSVNENALKTIIAYCEDRGYELVILPMKNAYKNRVDREDREISDYPAPLHPFLESSFYTEYIFNENIRAKDFLLLPQNKNPLSRLKEYGRKNYSLVIASPKQDMETVPVSKDKHPHIVHSTGTISNPDGYFNDTTGRIAEEEHVMGGLVIEVRDSKIFHLRQIQFDSQGGFNDLDCYYNGKKKTKAKVIACSLGDLHYKLHNEKILESTYEWVSLLSPEEIYLQDSVDMHSVNPHHTKSIYDRVYKHPELATLEQELNSYGEWLVSILTKYPKIKIYDVFSNHPYFLTRYIDDPNGGWLRDRPENVKVASELVYARINQIETNPIKYWVQKYFSQVNDRVVWTRAGESIERTSKKIEMNVHGHDGPNGSKGSKKGIRLAYQNAIQGHVHGAFIYGPLWGLGVMNWDMGYNVTPSNWISANIATYENGQRQMQVINRDGSWRLQ